ncbi:hypothetical protein [Streptomyces sp. 5-6(2022)]|uniref:hypothetical protein n=1 Tax=Streptomyces sp. 5-6(2022) TaxID=2936510 RepID=UPI0023B9A44F|nr:hypothetical protein [Streptomyces sp. 5-6(2022)]
MFDTRLAQTAVKAAERRRLTVPPEVYAAASMYDVVVQAGHEQHPQRPTRDDIPATPEELRQLIVQRAEAARHAESMRKVATDFEGPVASRFNQLVRDLVPGWIRALQPEFLTLTKALAAQSKKLPAELRVNMLDWNDPKVCAAWEKAESAAHQLDQLVRDRQDMAKAVGGDGGRDNELYAVALLPEPTEEAVFADRLRDEIGPVIREWKELHGQPVSRWLHLARAECVTLQLAVPDEVTARAAAMAKWKDALYARHEAYGRNAAVSAVRSVLAA